MLKSYNITTLKWFLIVALTAVFWILMSQPVLAGCIPNGQSGEINDPDNPCTSSSPCCSPDAVCQAEKISQGMVTRWRVECSLPSTEVLGSGEYKESKPIVPELQVDIPGFEGFTEEIEHREDEKVTYIIPWIGEYLIAIYKWAVRIIAALAVIMIMVAGVQWMLAGGNISQISDAKSRINHALIGLVLILGTSLILGFVNPQLTIFKPIVIGKIERVELSGGDFVGVPGEGLTPPFYEFFKQCDERWGGISYQPIGGHSSCKGTETICTSGCGVVAVATVINKKLGINVTPPEITDYAKEVKARVDCNSGTLMHILAPKLKEQWGVGYVAFNGQQKALDWLQKGNWLIGAIRNYVTISGKTIFTGGHFVVLYGISGNKVLIKDPYKTNIEFLPIENNQIKYAGNSFYYLSSGE